MDRFVAFFHIIGLIQKVVSVAIHDSLEGSYSVLKWVDHDEEENNYVSNKTAKA